MKKFMIKNKKGFTLIELIIVMAIIGILAVVAVVAIGSKSADARDARRLADMSAIRTAMALHCAEPVNAAGDDLTATTILCTSSTQPPVNTLVDAETTYIAFSTIFDPSHSTSTTACTSTADAVCDYAFGDPDDDGAAFTLTTSIDACDYWINFYQEGGDGYSYAADEGLVEGA